MRNKLIFFFGLLAILLPGLALAEYTDRVVAVVNDDVITLSELNHEGRVFFQRVLAQAPADESEAALGQVRREVLNHMIDNLLVVQKAAEMNIAVTDQEVDVALQQILARNNTSIERFRADIESMGVSEAEYRANLRKQMLRSRVVSYEVQSKVVVTDDRAREYHEKVLGSENGDGYRLLQMGFVWGPEPVPEEVRQQAAVRAARVREKAMAGESFVELARTFSELPSAADGGDIGLFSRDELGGAMREAILALAPGDISPVVETDSGYQFFKLLYVKEGDSVQRAGYEKVKSDIQSLLGQQAMEEQFDRWVKDLRRQAYIKDLL